MPVVTLPYPPSVNRLYRNQGGRMVKTDEARAYQHNAGLLVLRAAPSFGSAPMRVDITLHPKKPLRATGERARCIDLDNAIKCALDALNGVAWDDDRQIEMITAHRSEPVPGGALTISWGVLGGK